MISSTDGGSNFRLAKFSGLDTACDLKSAVFTTSAGKVKGYVDEVIVLTNTLGSGASCSLTLEVDQASTTSNAKTISTTSKRRHYFTGFGIGQIEDLLVAFDWSGGSASNPCIIRKVIINGHWVEAT